LLYVGLAALNQVLAATSTCVSADVAWRATNELRANLFRHTLDLDMAYHNDHLTGEMIERIDGDVSRLSNFFSQFLVRVLTAGLVTIGVLALLWSEQYVVGLSLTAFAIVALLILHRQRRIAILPMQHARQLSAEVAGFIEERLSGLDDIRANGGGRYVAHRFLEAQRRWFAGSVRAFWLNSLALFSTTGLFAVGHVLTLGLGVWLWQSGKITVGTVYLFFSYMSMIETPLDQFTRQLQDFQKAAASASRVRELLETRSKVQSGSVPLGGHAHSIRFDQVRFRYSGREVLRGLSFRLEPGETLGLLGRTGSGKTTLIRLLSHLYDPTEGRVLVDEIDLRMANLRELRQRIAVVTQDVQLFRGSLRDNLTFFNRRVRDETIWQVLDELRLRRWVENLPGKLDAMLDAGGAGLSAGEAQLIAFGRAFLRNPGIVILDEPSSRLDAATERLATHAVERLLAKRTGIIIAHRLETVERVDKIVVLAEGRIVEYGPREALADDSNSHYSMLRRLSSQFANLDDGLEHIA
jgi:ABC-type multidrug transport system fused ATPase/permease subunit